MHCIEELKILGIMWTKLMSSLIGFSSILLYPFVVIRIMPKVKTNRVKYPEGWELIEPTLRELQGKMREGYCLFLMHTALGVAFVTCLLDLYN